MSQEKTKYAKQHIVVYETKCRLCGEKIQATTDEECRQRLCDHLDYKCKVANTMREWEKAGIYKEMVSLLSQEGLINDLKKLLKKHSIEEIRDVLEKIELEEE